MSVIAPAPPPRARPARARRLARLRRWWIEHDDQLPFTLAYLGLALVLSLAIGLFWLVAVVALHAALEYWALGRQRHGARLGRVLWHVKLDIALVLFALCLAVYMDLLFGIAGLAPAARAGMQAGSRFLAWQKGIRGLLLSLDDAALLARSLAGRKDGDTERAVPSGPPPWREPWTVGDRISLGLGAGFAALLLAAPWLSGHDTTALLQLIGAELHPFPG